MTTTGSYQPGDVIISDMTLLSPRGTINLLDIFSSSRVYESIFVPNAMVEVDVLDVNDIIGTMVLVGDETMTVTFGAPGGVSATYLFAIDTISEVENTGATKSKTYTIHGVGEETLFSKTNYVQKSYNTDIASMVQDIHTNYLKSQKSLTTEATDGTQNILVPNYAPFAAIDLVRRRAVSTANKSSTYLYFENALGMYFKTIEGMFGQSPIKTYQHYNSGGSSIFNLNQNNIIGLEVPQIASSTDRIALGGLNQRTSTYNVRTRSYQKVDQQISGGIFGSGGLYNSAAFIAKYGQNFGKFNYIPVDTANRPQTQIPTATPFQMAYLSNMIQNQVLMKTFGDGMIKAGDVINLQLPEVINISGATPLDPQISGNFLVTRLCRNIGTSLERPRYTDSIECMSGSLAGGV